MTQTCFPTALTALVDALDLAVRPRRPAQPTVDAVAAALAPFLGRSDLLAPDQQIGDPAGYRQHLLHVPDDGAYSLVALVWLPGQSTAVHDHIAWCVVGVHEGAEREIRYRAVGEHLVEIDRVVSPQGSVAGLVPPATSTGWPTTVTEQPSHCTSTAQTCGSAAPASAVATNCRSWMHGPRESASPTLRPIWAGPRRGMGSCSRWACGVPTLALCPADPTTTRRPDTMDENVGTIIIGAGQAGLAMSRCLHDRGLAAPGAGARRNRATVAQRTVGLLHACSARTGRPGSPGHRFAGPDPEGFMGAAQVVEMLEALRARHARVRTGVTVDAVQRSGARLVGADQRGPVPRHRTSWSPPATWIVRPSRRSPRACPRGSGSCTPATYRNPAQLPRAGCSWSAPARPASRSPTSSPAPAGRAHRVGRHKSLPRRYRGPRRVLVDGPDGDARPHRRIAAALPPPVTAPPTPYSPAAPRTWTCTGSSATASYRTAT